MCRVNRAAAGGGPQVKGGRVWQRLKKKKKKDWLMVNEGRKEKADGEGMKIKIIVEGGVSRLL